MKPNKKTGAAVLITAALEAIGVCASKSTTPTFASGHSAQCFALCVL